MKLINNRVLVIPDPEQEQYIPGTKILAPANNNQLRGGTVVSVGNKCEVCTPDAVVRFRKDISGIPVRYTSSDGVVQDAIVLDEGQIIAVMEGEVIE